MSKPAAAYPDWKAPAAEGEILLWPEARQIVADTIESHRRLNEQSNIFIQYVPLPELRRRMRRLLRIHDDELALFSGHQTELYHPGVWAKDVMTSAAAAAIGGARAWHLAVDTDQPKHLVLRWPGGSEAISDDPRLNRAAWSGLLRAPSSEYLQQLQSKWSAAVSGWNFAPAETRFPAAAADVPLSRFLTEVIAAVDRAVGVKAEYAIASELFEAEPYLALASHVLARAGEVARAYNAALAEYRRQNKVRSSTRPMPDLLVRGDECEVPFWLDNLSAGERRRAAVRRDGGWFMESSGERFAFDAGADGWEIAAKLKAFLSNHQLRLAPRALTLTLFVRLCLADQFVHGIGGARYDQVTDQLIWQLFGIAPPKFSVTTATLYFPGAAAEPRVCLPCMEHEGHRLEHAVLGEEKMAMVREIDALPRNSIARQTAFRQLHARLDSVALEHPGLLEWRRRFEAARQRAEVEKSLFDRELFFAIQPTERLRELMGRYRSAFTELRDS